MESNIESKKESENVENNVRKDGRKLASVQIVSKIYPHTNSDNLALAAVLGWQVVIGKTELSEGQKAVYFEIDSKLPSDKEWAKFMESRNFRVKTIKLRGELSQGLLLPLKIIPDFTGNDNDYEEGFDLTEILGVSKYDDDADEIGTNINGQRVKVFSPFQQEFPSIFGIFKTDEPRIQSEPKYIASFNNQPYYATLKYDGTSATYFIDPDKYEEFYICSRNYRIIKGEEQVKIDVYTQTAKDYKIYDRLKKLEGKYAIQCEIYGPGIQENKLKSNKVNLAVFNVFDLKNKNYLDFEDVKKICGMLELPMVDIIEEGESFNYSLDDLKAKSKGKYPNTQNHREGLVFRLKNVWQNVRSRNSFKVINDDFLLKQK